MKKNILLLVLFSSIQTLFGQYEQISRFNYQDSSAATKQAFVIPIDSTTALAVWADGQFLYSATTSDYGATWENKNTISSKLGVFSSSPDINLLKLNNGRILLTYRAVYHFAKYSDDEGVTWSDSIQLYNKRNLNNSSLSLINDGQVWFCTSRYTDNLGLGNSKISYTLKSEDGILWTDNLDTLLVTENNHGYPSIFSIDTNTLGLVYREEVNEKYNIYLKRSSDNGITWNDKELIYESANGITRPRLNIKSNGNLLITFQEIISGQIENYKQYDIFFIESEDNGFTWSAPTQFTNYIGFDGIHNVSLIDDEPLISFVSNRNHVNEDINTYLQNDIKNVSIWIGVGGLSEDVITPPVLLDNRFSYDFFYPKTNVKVSAKVFDETAVSSVTFSYSLNHEGSFTLELFDDGLHNDELAGDMIFANRIDSILISDTINYKISITDNFQNTIETDEKWELPYYVKDEIAYMMDINNINLALDYNGILADASVVDSSGSRTSGGWFDGKRFLFSGGFALSGYSNGELWSNGIMTASRINDYLPGNVGGSDSSKFLLYIVTANDPAFGGSWNKWKDAVSLGANFYDGNDDGVYDPVDLNGNGQWDINEDSPDILGDVTVWCVVNDGKSASERRFTDVDPQGIEVKQTVFAYSPQTHPELANVIFIRYNIENTGAVAYKFDSVYFGAWSDPDLGDYIDDLGGSDTLINSGLVYNNGADTDYGENPPAFITGLLQGPLTYIPGITFIDNNGNNIFDDGIDTPKDSAAILSGLLLGETYIPGAMNLKMTSATPYLKYQQGEPENKFQLRNYLSGKNITGSFIDPCTWEYGSVFDMNCADVNPLFWYSGDPVLRNGWITNHPTDLRLMVNTGPFILEKDKPIEIIFAYVVGRGSDALNSITIAKDITRDVIGFYNTNFSYIPVGIKETKTETIPTKFVLEQNYPNPFNPTTTIKYSIPTNIKLPPLAKGRAGVGSQVTLKVYDILGREVAVLVNESQKPGNYKIKFNAGSLSSGVYYYRLKTNSFIQTRKMLLLK